MVHKGVGWSKGIDNMPDVGGLRAWKGQKKSKGTQKGPLGPKEVLHLGKERGADGRDS